MRNAYQIDINALKRRQTPERYYAVHLNGRFGKPTGQGWHAWNGLCPFHMDKRPGSFVVNKQTGGFKCFSCGARGGDIIAFHMKRYGLAFDAALQDIEEGRSHA